MEGPESTLDEHIHRVVALLEDPHNPQLLGEELRALRQRLMNHESERRELRREVARLEAERLRLSRGLDAAHRRGTDLASLYVATHRLHATLDRGQVLQAIEEIVASLLACEELALFEMGGTPAALALVLRVGVPMDRIGRLRAGEGELGRSIATGEIWLAPEGVLSPLGVTACVPLQVDGQVTGALVLFGLLKHKGRLEAADRELLEVLSTHAGTALLATRRHGRGGIDPSSRKSV